MKGWRLLLTRPADESQALARTLAESGVFSASLPLLEIEPLPMTEERRAIVYNLATYCAVIVVSKPAARLGLEWVDEVWPQPPMQHWFAVGAATAQILDDYNLRVFFPERGDDSEALLDLPQLQETLAAVYDPKVLIMRGEEGREWLADRLRERGASVDYLPLYRRFLPQYPAFALPGIVQAERLNGLVVSSGQGFQHLRELAGDAWAALSQMPLFVPSPRVAELAREAGAQTVVDCRGASASALLTALRAYPAPVSPAS
ncbi:uroporphyrinogen-III synthase [Pseudomonas sp. GD03842]|uniref:uroporphyrinogen-III synthase n=1 Tax=Pseudomonas sp. GD03842 TaxID=2975385 RepID=UPI00244D690B|nr:uroporphyrinogen-III synthase [Pseudomonas sp. GD03842]MDH0745889.1 uroporphyrinogen-III synthase [Pseudomonas sp. GD03842]